MDYDYSTVAAQQRPAADLLWYDYGGVGGGSNGLGGGGGGNAVSGSGGYYGSGGVGSSTSGLAPAVLIGAEKRGGASQSSSANIWFGPRLGRRKRRGGVGSTFNGGLVQPIDGNAFGPAAMSPPQEAMAAVSLSTAAGQAVVSDLINNAPWVLVPVVENSREYINHIV